MPSLKTMEGEQSIEKKNVKKKSIKCIKRREKKEYKKGEKKRI